VFTSTPARPARIEIKLYGLAQLFDSLDPAPFRQKSLNREAHRFILGCAEEFDRHTSLTLVIHAPSKVLDYGDDIADAIRDHFRYESEQSERDLRRRMRQGRLTAIRGFVVLVFCLLLRRAIVGLHWPGVDFFAEGLGILGWVVLWHPLDILLFERSESRDQNYWLRQLSRVPIQFMATQASDALVSSEPVSSAHPPFPRGDT